MTGLHFCEALEEERLISGDKYEAPFASGEPGLTRKERRGNLLGSQNCFLQRKTVTGKKRGSKHRTARVRSVSAAEHEGDHSFHRKHVTPCKDICGLPSSLLVDTKTVPKPASPFTPCLKTAARAAPRRPENETGLAVIFVILSFSLDARTVTSSS